MKRTRRSGAKHIKQPCIKIYTTQELVNAFMARAAEVNRSMSQHGEFLVKQDLALSNTQKVA